MKSRHLKVYGFALWALLMAVSWLAPTALFAKENVVMGRIEFHADSHVEKTSGVWVDGQYVGYLRELKGSKSVMLLPGEHNITVREDGYKEFSEQISVQPGQTQVVRVALIKDPAQRYPMVTAMLKISVDPSRAAVFVDGLYVGHVGEFEGVGRGLLVSPGTHRIKIALPGYQTFETEVRPIAKQTVEVKTRLAKSTGPLEAPLVNQDTHATNPPSETGDTTAQTH